MPPSSPADLVSRGLAGVVLAVATLTAVTLAATEGSNASSASSSPSSATGVPPGAAPGAAPGASPRDCIGQLRPDFPFPPGSRRTTIPPDPRIERAFGRLVRSDLDAMREFYRGEMARRGIAWAPLGSDSPIGIGSWFGALTSGELEFGCFLNLSDNDATGEGPAGTVTISVELR